MIEGISYLSGPMNSQEAVRRMFKFAEQLRHKNVEVVNPADVLYGETAYSHLPAEGLRNGLSLLAGAKNIILSPGWQQARGCIIEMFEAALTGTEIFTLDESQLEQGIILLEKYSVLPEKLNEVVAELLLTQEKTHKLTQISTDLQ